MENIIEEKLSLERELQEAVESEDFERAAKLRDRIKELNEKIVKQESGKSD